MLGLNQNAYHNFGLSGAFGGTLMDDTGKCVADQTTGWADGFKLHGRPQGRRREVLHGRQRPQAGLPDRQAQRRHRRPVADGRLLQGPRRQRSPSPPIPAGTGTANPLTGTDGWYINPNSKNMDLAIALALQLVGDRQRADHDQRRRPCPGGPRRDDRHRRIVQGFADAAAAGLPRPQRAEFNNYWGGFGDALNRVLDKGEDADRGHRHCLQDHERGEQEVAFAPSHDPGAPRGAPGVVPGPRSTTERSPIRGRYAGHPSHDPGRRTQEEGHPGMATAAAVSPAPPKRRNWRRRAQPYSYLVPALAVMTRHHLLPAGLPGLDVVHGLRPQELPGQQPHRAQLRRARQLHPDRDLPAPDPELRVRPARPVQPVVGALQRRAPRHPRRADRRPAQHEGPDRSGASTGPCSSSRS